MENVKKESRSDKESRTKKFTKPTIEEIRQYCRECGFKIDAEYLFDHYESVDWIVGRGKPMKDWKASVRNWARRDKQGVFGTVKQNNDKSQVRKTKFSNFEERNIDFEYIKKLECERIQKEMGGEDFDIEEWQKSRREGKL